MRILFLSFILLLSACASAPQNAPRNKVSVIEPGAKLVIVEPYAELTIKMANAKSIRQSAWSDSAQENMRTALYEALSANAGGYTLLNSLNDLWPRQKQLVRLGEVAAQGDNYGRVKTIGPGAFAFAENGADYALISIVRGSYNSRGKKLMNIASSALVGYSDGKEQRATLLLIDTKSGDIVWQNSTKFSQNARKEKGAAKITKKLLQGFAVKKTIDHERGVNIYQGTYSKFLMQNWSVVRRKTGKGKAVEVLTLDGPDLNAVYVFKDIKKGDELLRTKNFQMQMPRYNVKMNDHEKVAFIIESFGKGVGLRNLQASSAVRRPLTNSALPKQGGLYFNLTGTTPTGLNMRGRALMADFEGGLSLIIFIAPSEYYHGREKAEVGALFQALSNGF